MNEMHFRPLSFPAHTVPDGHLPEDIRAQACWYYYLLAHSRWEKTDRGIDNQIVLEGERWLSPHYDRLAKTVAMIYGLESPSEFAKFWRYVEAEAARQGLPAPLSRYKMIGPDRSKLIL